MRFWKHTLITAFAFVGISSTVLYTSCEQDSCIDLKCRNGGSCSEGFCRCKPGYEGSECEYKASEKFIATYYGYTKCNMDAPRIDSIRIREVAVPSTVSVIQYSKFTDTLRGTVSTDGFEILIPDRNGVHYVAKLDRNQLTFYTEQTVNGQLRTCTFLGTRSLPSE